MRTKVLNIRVYYLVRLKNGNTSQRHIDLKMTDYKADIMKTTVRDTHLAIYSKKTPTYSNIENLIRVTELLKENIYVNGSIHKVEER